MRPEGGGSSVMVWTALDTALVEERGDTVVGWSPAIHDMASTCSGGSAETRVSLVHHINLYDYKGDLALTTGRPYMVKGDMLQKTGVNESSFRMLASHDKDAGEFILPPGYGIPFGHKVLMERHVLFPKCWNFSSELLETSGMNVYMTSRALKPASLVGALNFNMDVQPQQGPVEWITRMSSDHVRNLVDAEKDDWPEILAVHLHTHDVARSKFFEVLNADGSVTFRSDTEKAGYGLKEQSFASLTEKGWPRLRLRPGQQLLQHCLFDSDRLEFPVQYGLDWGQEMCAPLLLIGGSRIRLMPTVLSSNDGYLFHLTAGMWADIVHDSKRLLSEFSRSGLFR